MTPIQAILTIHFAPLFLGLAMIFQMALEITKEYTIIPNHSESQGSILAGIMLLCTPIKNWHFIYYMAQEKHWVREIIVEHLIATNQITPK